jgi:mono/diheme cytochrome c family protein
MITPFISRPAKVLPMMFAAIAVTALATACGTEKISVAQDSPNYNGAHLFNQRCSGCHTLSYAATHGSAANVRSREIVNGPNFNVRCERPVTRVLYAIQNGGFSGAIMPQNIVVGQDATEVAKFVATYAGRQAKGTPGVANCQQQSIGTIPPPTPTATTASSSTPASTTTTTTSSSKGGSSGSKNTQSGKSQSAKKQSGKSANG